MLNAKEINLVGLAIALLFIGCVEPFEAEVLDFENALVVDARLTNEVKQQQISLSRSYRFGTEALLPETDASIQIIDENGTTYPFVEDEPGFYKSTSAFAAQPNVGYELSISTTSGTLYQSETVVTPESVAIKELKAELDVSDSGEEGLQIALTNESARSEATYFRVEYEETYKIIAPFYNPSEFEVVDSLYFTIGDQDSFEINIIGRTEEAQTCYGTNISTAILLSDSEGNTGGQTGKTTVRFLRSDEFMISHRYSILVKQFGLTQEAHGYYATLDDFTSSEGVFSEVQPGFLKGNITALNSDELVLGYFEVASVNTKRYFFNYTDFFPQNPLPPYPINCEPTGAPPLISYNPHIDGEYIVDEASPQSPLLNGILSGAIAYHAINEEYVESEDVIQPPAGEAPYFVKATPCIDCRALGSNVKPDFWVE